MFVFAVEMQELEMQEVVGFGNLADDDVVAVEDVFRGTNFDHFDVAQRTVGGALPYCKAAVSEVHEHFAALKVVPGERLGEIALGCVRKHQQGEAVLVL